LVLFKKQHFISSFLALDNMEESFICPILQTVMKNPVLTPNGVTYEREAIVGWIKRSGTDPVSRKPLKEEQLVPNRSLKDAIEAFQAKNQDSKPKTKEKSNLRSDVNDIDELSIVPMFKRNGKDVDVCISINVPKSVPRKALDLVLVLDVSGSMSAKQSVTNEAGERESHGLTALDVVKHASRTVINSLGEDDRVCIITFSNNSNRIYNWQYMNDQNKQSATLALSNQYPSGGTNMWSGIAESLHALQDSREPALKKIFLLTDGRPNMAPPRGWTASMEKAKRKSTVNFTMNTFGFGYHLKSDILYDLACVCNGTYSFIPDAGMVGTNFVNNVATLLTTYQPNVKLNIEPKNGVLTQTNEIDVADLFISRSRDVVFRLTLPEVLPKEKNAKLADFNVFVRGKKKNFSITMKDIDKPLKDFTRKFANEIGRVSYANALKSFWSHNHNGVHDPALKGMQLIEELKKIPAETAYLKAIRKEVIGEVTLACTKAENWKKWGKHYLASLARSHELQMCTNFKDIALQFYTSDLFEKVRDELDDIFLKLPAPKPRAPSTSLANSCRGASSIPAPPIQMSHYYNQSYGCFAGFCKAQVSKDEFKRCDLLKKGDKVLNGKGSTGTIKCVVRTKIAEESVPLIKIRNLVSTPFHPVKIDGRWQFPVHVKNSQRQRFDVKYVYSFLLESGESMIIEDTECICYNHQIENDPVATHPFFGTEKVIEELQRFEGFTDGLVTIKGVNRNPATGLIESFEG